MPRSKQEVISEMVDSGLFSDDEIRHAAGQQSGASTPAPSSNIPSSPADFVKSAAKSTMEMLPFPTSMEGAQRLLSPSAGQFGPSRIMEGEGQRVGAAVRGAAQNTAESLSTSKLGQMFPRTMAVPGAIYGTLADVASNSLTPSGIQQQIGGEAVGMGLNQIPGLNTSLERGAVNQGMRATGFSKRFLNTPEKLVGARQAVRTALEEGAIPSFTGAENMRAGIDEMGNNAGVNIGDYLQSRGVGFDPQDAIKKINALRPPYQGGEYDPIHSVIDRAVQTVQAHGPGPLGFQEANDIKSLFQQLAYELKSDKGGVRKGIAGAYRQALEDALQAATAEPIIPPSTPGAQARNGANPQIQGSQPQGLPLKSLTIPPSQVAPGRAASGLPSINSPTTFQEAVNPEIVNELSRGRQPMTGQAPQPPPTMDMKLTRPDMEAFKDFQRNRQIYGAAERIKSSLNDKIAAEQGNKQLGLRDTLYLANGHGLMSIANHLYDRFGAGLGANMLWALANPSDVTPGLRAALAAALERRRQNAAAQ